MRKHGRILIRKVAAANICFANITTAGSYVEDRSEGKIWARDRDMNSIIIIGAVEPPRRK